jgi:glutaminyl-tRNA synthetase
LTNYPEGKVEEFEAINNPEDESAGTRWLPFCRELYLEQEDFREDPPRKWFRLAPGAEVRLKHAYYITCQDVIKDPETGEVLELRCTYDPESRGGSTPDGRRVKGTLHWVSAPHAVDAEVRLYDRLFTAQNPMDVEEGKDWTESLNPDSFQVLEGCKVEPSLAEVVPGSRCQFLRLGYFVADPDSARAGRCSTRRSRCGIRGPRSRKRSSGGDKGGGRPCPVGAGLRFGTQLLLC